MSYLQNILNVFFGSTRRAQWTLVGVAILYGSMRPDVIKSLIAQLLSAVITAISPFIPTIFTLAIMAFGASFLLKSAFGKKRNPGR